jgi:alpha/beta superfamily hydrolase
VQGDKDEIVTEESARKLAEKLGKQKDITVDYRVIKGANHFFTDRLDKLAAATSDYIAGTMRPATEKKPASRAKASAR